MSRSQTLAPLRERNFRWYYLAELVNLTGSLMSGVALAFAVLEVSSSPSALGAVLAAHSIPMVLFTLAGGVLADRFGRKRIIQAANVLAGLTQLAIGVLVLSGAAELWQLVVLSAINGVVASIGLPALLSLIPQLVPRQDLQSANLLMSVQRNTLAILGPTVAGLLVVGFGAGWAVAVDGVTFLIAACLLVRVRIPPPVPREDSAPMFSELRDGWTFFAATQWLWIVVVSFSLLNALSQGGFWTLAPVLSKQTSIGESGYGLILSAQAVGLLVASLVLLRVRLRRPLLWGMVGIAVNGLPMIVLGLHPVLIAAMAVACLAGAGVETFGLGWNLALQEHVPDEMLSRAYSYDILGSLVAVPVGQLAFGPLAAAFGIQQMMTIAGLAYVAIALLTLCSRSVRDLPRMTTAEAAVTT